MVCIRYYHSTRQVDYKEVFMKNNVVVQFSVLVLAVTAGQLLLKVGVSFFPQTGILGSVRSVVTNL